LNHKRFTGLNNFWNGHLQKHAREGGVSRREFRLRRKDNGEIRVIEAVETVRANAKGEVEWVVGTNLDVTERRRAEAKMRESELRYRAFFENAATGAVELDSSGRFLSANQRFCELVGYVEQELKSLRAMDLTHPDDRERERSIVSAFLSGKTDTVDYEKRFVRKDGRSIWSRVNAALVKDETGALLYTVGVISDIDGQKRTTDALRESEEKFRNSVADAAIGFAMNTPDGVFVDANAVFCRLTGYSVEELRRMTFSDLAHPDDIPANMKAAQRMLSGEVASYVIENRHCRKDGSLVWVRKSLSTTRDSKGQVKWIVALVEDVSERIQAEANLKHLNATLEERVREEIVKRQEAQARLAQAEKLSALGQLAGGVAHDFNNIAQAVTGGASMIGRHAEDPAKVRRYAGMLAEAATRAASITRRLLSLARRGDLKAEAVDVAPLLQGLREFLSHTLGPNVALQVKAPTDLPPIFVDKGQLETALVNLATNARDALDGTGSITFAAALERLPGGRNLIGLAPRLLYPHRGHRYRSGHGCGDDRTGYGAVLHHQGAWQRHGPRSADGAGLRPAVGRRSRSPKRHRARHDDLDLAARRRRGRDLAAS
jgi:PAS domain S-box-containing protein